MYGIPYSKAPEGDLRWKAPRDFEFKSNRFEATKLPNRCVQVSNFYDELITSYEAVNKKSLERYTYTNTKNRLHFSVKNPDEELPKIIRILSKSGLHIQSIESTKSSLEDVFLNLTGKGINE